MYDVRRSKCLPARISMQSPGVTNQRVHLMIFSSSMSLPLWIHQDPATLQDAPLLAITGTIVITYNIVKTIAPAPINGLINGSLGIQPQWSDNPTSNW